MLVLYACAAILAVDAQFPSERVRAAYQEARAAVGPSAEAQVRLALWCEARGLADLERAHLKLAIEADPDQPIARRLLGQMVDEGRWRTPAEAIERAGNQADRRDALARYARRRDQIADTPQAHWQMARWAEEAGLLAEAEVHLRAVVRLDPAREEAWKKLGARKQGSRWVFPDRAAIEKSEIEARRKADARWRPLLARWKTWLGQPSKQPEAEALLRGVTDPLAVPSIGKVFGSGSPESQKIAVRLLTQIDDPSASRGLAWLAIFGGSESIRRLAAESLAGRDPRESAPWLIGLLQDRIRYEVKPVGGPGSPGELYVQGKTANTRRFYAAPPPPLDFRPGDTWDRDAYGFAIVRRQVGYTSQPIQAALDPLYSGAPDMTGVGANLAQAGLGATGQQLGDQLFANQQANSSLLGKTTAAGGGASSFAGGGFNAPIQAEIPIGQLMMLAQQQAAFARENLRWDVASLDRYNAGVDQINDRARMALKIVAGESPGEDPDAWRKWWGELSETSTIAPPLSRDVGAVEPEPPLPSGSKARMPAFVEGTPVWTRAGLRTIEDLRGGDLILTQDLDSGALAFTPVFSTRRIDRGMTRTLRVGDGSIAGTDLERLWVAGRGWVPLADLEPGDRIRGLDGLSKVLDAGRSNPQSVYHVQVGDRRGILVGRDGLLAHDDRVHEAVAAPFDATSDPRTLGGDR
ncbi:hypothetical protein P12x_002251 [Tundrisphaera lichenicola]|uniref:tetratricopeptide repeat protein n=1 Tax=Tundrisphaera lichenicola TaxID=2029860 RepID=UPI003EBFAE23